MKRAYKPWEYYEENIKRYRIPINKVIETLEALEAIGISTDEACEMITQQIREGRLK